MWRNPKAEVPSTADETGDLGGGFHSTRGGGFPVKRNPNPNPYPRNLATDEGDRRSDRRSSRHQRRGARKGFSIRGASAFYLALLLAVVLFLVAATMLQSSSMSVFRSGARERFSRERQVVRNALRFMPARLWRRFSRQGGLDRFRSEPRFGVREPRLAFVLGSMKRDPFSLMMFTLVKRLQGLGYKPSIYAVEDGEAYPLWEKTGCQLSVLGPKGPGHIDWSIYEGIVLSSLQAKVALSSLMQEPFRSIPVIWIVPEDTLGKRLPVYAEMGWEYLISEWRNAFSRPDVVVFPDFSLPMLYSMLDTGNFFVISGSPVDVWAAESLVSSQSKYSLRKEAGFSGDDLVILVIGSSLFYNELPWDYAVAMHTIGPLLMKLKRAQENQGGSFKFVFLCGNSTDSYYDALQEIASHIGLPDGSIKHYGMDDDDVNSVLIMADIVLYASFQEEQGFPPLLIRVMSFKIPVIAPDLAVIKKHVVDGVHGLIFRARNPDSLTRSFSLLISGMKLSKFANVIASSGKLLARDMLALECITGYARLLENILQFPSETLLPASISEIQQQTWEWSFFNEETEQRETGAEMDKLSLLDTLEAEFAGKYHGMDNSSQKEIDTLIHDSPTQRDWDALREMETAEEFERREMEELEERSERTLGSWDEVYRTAKKAEKIKFEANERDEGELERTGQPLCIYEIYTGPGAWPFLHHGSLYRGLSLSSNARRSKSDDVDAVARLQLLNDTYYRDLLCEIGGMFSIARKVDNIHRIPWIGFQSWHARGWKVSLSAKAENVLEETIQAETKGDVIYYWVRMDMDARVKGVSANLDFWSLCDILNGGSCRVLFEKSFRNMYDIPLEMEALPPMPNDGNYWSTLHSWAMPTPSFLEFIMFARMFADSLDAVNHNLSNTTCLLGSSNMEKRHCYCRMLELLVNVWAYHSARKMVYINPVSGALEEQHPFEQRKGLMWVKYFNFTLLKSMDEDLAEEADDNDHPTDGWLWPLTGEVHWQGVYEREREDRYRFKMDKKRKTKEKLLERQRHGYKQKTLGA